MASSSSDTKKKEIYTYEAPWTTYAMGWCRRPDGRFRMAVGSYKEEYSNQVQIIQLQRDEAGNGVFRHQCEFEHPYPATKVMWAPAKHNLGGTTDLLATTGDYLRLWSTSIDGSDNKVEMKAHLNNNKHTGIQLNLTYLHILKIKFVKLST
jgi:DDB1- and CUL4-associated factor 7